jgi:hypothetical protein
MICLLGLVETGRGVQAMLRFCPRKDGSNIDGRDFLFLPLKWVSDKMYIPSFMKIGTEI